jgi:hypothetical protein
MAAFLSILPFYRSSFVRHITNITYFSNRTIDYLTAAKPEAYQAHSRRVSASKAAIQKQQQQQHQQGKHAQEYKKTENRIPQQNNNNALPCGCPPSYESSAYDLRPNLEPALPFHHREHEPRRIHQQPHSAPAILPSTSKKMAIAQGEIPIGIEPSLSPSVNTEMDC